MQASKRAARRRTGGPSPLGIGYSRACSGFEVGVEEREVGCEGGVLARGSRAHEKNGSEYLDEGAPRSGLEDLRAVTRVSFLPSFSLPRRHPLSPYATPP